MVITARRVGVSQQNLFLNTSYLVIAPLVLLVIMMSRSTAAMSTTSAAATSSSKVSAARPLHIHLFRQADLRLHDNPSLCETINTAKKSSNNDGTTNGILPIFCFDPRIYGNTALSQFGSLKCGPRRAQFALECVADLRSNLERAGSGLVVAHGKPEDVIQSILNKNKVDNPIGDGNDESTIIPKVFCQQEVASEEIRVEKAVRSVVESQSGSLETVWGSTLYDPDDLPFDDGVYGMPDTFTPFRNKVEKNCEIGQPLPVPSDVELKLTSDKSVLDAVTNWALDKCSLSYMPTLEDLGYTREQIKVATTHDERGVMQFMGGETAGLTRLKEYIWDQDRLKIYFDTRNGMIGADYSTKFSPWLAHGCLSPRYIASECRRYESIRVANKSTYWVVFELLWRDFFKFFAQKHGNNIFFLDGTAGGAHPNSRRWGLDRRTLAAWKEGRTGYPLVDANMRELAATGFQSNRGRQNVASFLALDTNTDWRYGADYFETELLDYDPYSNWGNWCSAAGMTGGRINRFNTIKQSKDYDCGGDYVRLWLPELKDVPTSLIHEPWRMTKEQQEEYGVRLGVDYPMPMVEPFYPKPRDNTNKKGDRRKKKKNNRGGHNPNRGKGQRRDMKSLDQGSYNFK